MVLFCQAHGGGQLRIFGLIHKQYRFAVRADIPQVVCQQQSVLRAAMDTLDKVQQGAQAPEERS